MKIGLIIINTEESCGPFSPMVEKVCKQAARADTEIEILWVSPGLERATDVHPYFFFLNEREVIEKVIEAEEHGCDAVVIGCYCDPGLHKVRGIVNIPVIGLCESSIHFASQLGRRFGVVTLASQSIIDGTEDNIILYGLRDKAITPSVRAQSMSIADTFIKGIADPKIAADDVVKAAKECVADGANVVIIGCLGLGVLCTSAGVTRVDESVPLVDCVPVGIKTAEMMVDLRKVRGEPFVSRIGTYALPRKKNFDRIRSTFGL